MSIKSRAMGSRAGRAAQCFAAGGAVHSDVKADKSMISSAVHKHEKAMHPGKPVTPMRRGGCVK